MKVAVNIQTNTIVDILPDTATESNRFLTSNGYKLLDIEDAYKMVDGEPVFRELTPEEIEAVNAVSSKEERQLRLDNLEVKYEDVVYQADERSQSRMWRSAESMEVGEVISWIAKDNSRHDLDKEQMTELAAMATKAQVKLWE